MMLKRNIEKELLGLEIQEYIIAKTDQILDELFKYFPQVDEFEIDLEIGCFEVETT